MKLSDVAGLVEFLQTEKVAVLSLPIDNYGTLHSAALLFAPVKDSLQLVFVTGKESDKCRMLLSGDSVKAACAIGTTKGTAFSLQLRGEVKLIDYADASVYLDAYEKKFGKRVDEMSKNNQVVLIFTSNWARVTDYVSENFADGFKRIQLELG